MVPHITDAIQEWVMKQAKVSVDDDDAEPQVCIIEVSWTEGAVTAFTSVFTLREHDFSFTGFVAYSDSGC